MPELQQQPAVEQAEHPEQHAVRPAGARVDRLAGVGRARARPEQRLVVVGQLHGKEALEVVGERRRRGGHLHPAVDVAREGGERAPEGVHVVEAVVELHVGAALAVRLAHLALGHVVAGWHRKELLGRRTLAQVGERLEAGAALEIGVAVPAVAPAGLVVLVVLDVGAGAVDRAGEARPARAVEGGVARLEPGVARGRRASGRDELEGVDGGPVLARVEHEVVDVAGLQLPLREVHPRVLGRGGGCLAGRVPGRRVEVHQRRLRPGA
mmetsp:Transcript_33933/g.109193  ORF Transcript_33933/g.109193 Transcript_33933/m.109193 type:complete len:267 (+) Transcript_33933:1338-2138(+)